MNAFTHADQMMYTMGYKSVLRDQKKPKPEEILTYRSVGLKLPKQEIKGAKQFPTWTGKHH